MRFEGRTPALQRTHIVPVFYGSEVHVYGGKTPPTQPTKYFKNKLAEERNQNICAAACYAVKHFGEQNDKP